MCDTVLAALAQGILLVRWRLFIYVWYVLNADTIVCPYGLLVYRMIAAIAPLLLVGDTRSASSFMGMQVSLGLDRVSYGCERIWLPHAQMTPNFHSSRQNSRKSTGQSNNLKMWKVVNVFEYVQTDKNAVLPFFVSSNDCARKVSLARCKRHVRGSPPNP
jgi:hypothetical protein